MRPSGRVTRIRRQIIVDELVWGASSHFQAIVGFCLAASSSSGQTAKGDGHGTELCPIPKTIRMPWPVPQVPRYSKKEYCTASTRQYRAQMEGKQGCWE
jgi:hypothetical protein